MNRLLLIFILFSVLSSDALAQDTAHLVLQAKIIEGDTIPVVVLKEVEVFSLIIPKNKKKQRRLTRFIKNVKIVYPYAKLAGIELRKYEYQLDHAKNDKERRRLMKQAEDEIKKKYGGDLKELTFSQGKILIKLIYRETGESSYQLVRDLRGKFPAFFYQAFAKLWGYNLKIGYDPEGEDRELETVVKMIERGQI